MSDNVHRMADRAYTGLEDEASKAQETALVCGGAVSSLKRRAHNHRAAQKLEGLYFPLGFPVRVSSNSSWVLAAADRSWRTFNPMFQRIPLRVHFRVHPDPQSIAMLPGPPQHECRGGLLLQVADADNMMVTDLRNGRAYGKVTASTVLCQSYFRYHFLEAAALSMIATKRCVPIHGACVEVDGKGILLCGDSGAGKSTLSFGCARAGCTFVSDDASYLVLDRKDKLVVGNCHSVRFRPSAVELFPEIAGRPTTPRAAGKPSIEASTSDWPALRVAPATHVSYVVFLNRSSMDQQQLLPVAATSAMRWFKRQVISVADVSNAQEAALSNLLNSKVFELRYRELSWAIDRLHQMAQRGE